MTTVVGTAPAGSMAAACGTKIQARVKVTESAYMAGVQVIEVPGLSYYASVEAAKEAVRLLELGQYPLVHGPARKCGDL